VAEYRFASHPSLSARWMGHPAPAIDGHPAMTLCVELESEEIVL
jgi:hypothetical protein